MCIVEGASLATGEPSYSFPFEKARSFQDEVLKWLHEGSEDVAVLNSPTGSGKTATFIEMCRHRGKTLLVYPTNALLKQQREKLENELSGDNLNIALVSGATLTKTGKERLHELRTTIEMNDVLITNPDILQEILTGHYTKSWIDPAQKAIELFDLFGQAIYDEFHYYSDFAASGIIMQIKTLLERSSPKLLLSSATPKDEILKDLDRVFSIREITPRYDDSGDCFRYDVEMERVSDEGMWENRETIGEKLSELLSVYDERRCGPHVVLIFNSVYDSNRFYTYMADEFAEVYEYMEKDNGYDTRQKGGEPRPEEHLILNTTNKGEVGLDYDIQHLFMEKPRDSDSFIQRFGRAGRQSPAKVYLYRIGQVSWPEKMTFPEFEGEVKKTIGKVSKETEDILRELIGLRAAYALSKRDVQNPEIYEDFTNYDAYGKWKAFLEKLQNSMESGTGLPLEPRTANLLEFTRNCVEALGSLRGRTISYQIRYPRGNAVKETSYGLLSAFKNYRISEVREDGGYLSLEEEDREKKYSIQITLPGYERSPWHDIQGSFKLAEQQLKKKIYNRVKNASLETEALSRRQLHEFFKNISILKSATPARIQYDGYRFTIGWKNEIPKVEKIDRI